MNIVENGRYLRTEKRKRRLYMMARIHTETRKATLSLSVKKLFYCSGK
jgi:hypothetical protein